MRKRKTMKTVKNEGKELQRVRVVVPYHRNLLRVLYRFSYETPIMMELKQRRMVLQHEIYNGALYMHYTCRAKQLEAKIMRN